ncbi:glycine-rich protein, partial [Opitutales bacterium]|nr:glycine-rich protein [Opitutales bacterium]
MKKFQHNIIFPLSVLLYAGFLNGQTYTFTNAGATGREGPTQAQVDANYTGTNLAGNVTINTQGIQEWVVPADGDYSIEAYGAQGGSGGTWSSSFYSTGGLGGYASGKIFLNAGATIYIFVGQQGEGYPNRTERIGSIKRGGWNGGGDSSYGTSATGGGGASDVRLVGIDLTDRAIVAGGGGGGGNAETAVKLSNGGNGGGLDGQTKPNSSQFSNRTPGIGGSQTSGHTLGNGQNTLTNLSGGGGGGFYGGTVGANSTGGGGGSSYVGGVFNASTISGANIGHGKVIITFLGSANESPVISQGAGPISKVSSEDSQVSWNASELNATDSDTNPAQLSWSLLSSPSNGTAIVDGNGSSPEVFTYQPNANYYGSDS